MSKPSPCLTSAAPQLADPQQPDAYLRDLHGRIARVERALRHATAPHDLFYRGEVTGLRAARYVYLRFLAMQEEASHGR